jgi:hypothetical protein
VTSSEVARDFDAVAAALWPAPGPSEGSAGPAPQDPTVEDLEERFRAGSE